MNKNLIALRKKIDALDDEILTNINQRLQLARQISQYKSTLRDPQREAEVLDRVRIKAKQLENLREDFITKLYSLIIKESLFLQWEKKGRNFEAEEKMLLASNSIKKIALIGCGQMGRWFADQLKEMVELAIYDVDQEKIKEIKGIYLLSNLTQLKDFKPDCVLNAVNIENTIPVFKSILDYLPSDCLLADITSVKGDLPLHYQQWERRFVSSHPMFGPTFADINHLAEENAIIISESDEEGKAFFRKFYSQFDLNLYEYTFNEHDQIIAYSLTVPFASTMVFAAHLHSSAVPGTTFKKHLKIAQGLLQESDYLLAEILFNPYSLPQLEKITQRLELLKHIIREKDYEEAFNFFHRLRENIKK